MSNHKDPIAWLGSPAVTALLERWEKERAGDMKFCHVSHCADPVEWCKKCQQYRCEQHGCDCTCETCGLPLRDGRTEVQLRGMEDAETGYVDEWVGCTACVETPWEREYQQLSGFEWQDFVDSTEVGF